MSRNRALRSSGMRIGGLRVCVLVASTIASIAHSEAPLTAGTVYPEDVPSVIETSQAATAVALDAVAANASLNGAETSSLMLWPRCQEQNVSIPGMEQAALTNLQGLGAVSGCFQHDCIWSDKFKASSIESCPRICLSVPECKFWVWGTEHGENKCWLRSGDDGRVQNMTGWVLGSKSCFPQGQKPDVFGNHECWIGGFNYNHCCSLQHGPGGNPQCWDADFSYDRCCLPHVVL